MGIHLLDPETGSLVTVSSGVPPQCGTDPALDQGKIERARIRKRGLDTNQIVIDMNDVVSEYSHICNNRSRYNLGLRAVVEYYTERNKRIVGVIAKSELQHVPEKIKGAMADIVPVPVEQCAQLLVKVAQEACCPLLTNKDIVHNFVKALPGVKISIAFSTGGRFYPGPSCMDDTRSRLGSCSELTLSGSSEHPRVKRWSRKQSDASSDSFGESSAVTKGSSEESLRRSIAVAGARSEENVHVLHDFDGVEYGPEYLRVSKGDVLRAGPQGEEGGWMHAIHCKDGENVEGWLPAEYVARFSPMIQAHRTQAGERPITVDIASGNLAPVRSSSLHVCCDALQQVIGHWTDEWGSTYEVSLDKSEKTCSVRTTRPGGRLRTTPGLIRYEESKDGSTGSVLWNKSFLLDVTKSSASVVHWHNLRRKPDFVWTRTHTGASGYAAVPGATHAVRGAFHKVEHVRSRMAPVLEEYDLAENDSDHENPDNEVRHSPKWHFLQGRWWCEQADGTLRAVDGTIMKHPTDTKSHGTIVEDFHVPNLGFADSICGHIAELRQKLADIDICIVSYVPKRRIMQSLEEPVDAGSGELQEVAPWCLVCLSLKGSPERLCDLRCGGLPITIEQPVGAPLPLKFKARNSSRNASGKPLLATSRALARGQWRPTDDASSSATPSSFRDSFRDA